MSAAGPEALAPLPTGLDFRLLNEFQRGFPLDARPYAQLAGKLECTEADVLARLARLAAAGTVSRVGAVFAPGRVGASTLAALAVPPERLDAVAALVSAHAEVNHNYEREHRFNLWYVAAAADGAALARVLGDIARETACEAIVAPLVTEYHIDLGFDLGPQGGRTRHGPGSRAARVLAPAERRLMQALEGGLPLVARPYLGLGAAAGLDESEVLATLARWLAEGLVKRLGVIVRHHELGYRANAMCVWDVPDAAVDALGARLAGMAGVNLCYRRRRDAGWNYNLYCMLHGRDRSAVLARLAALSSECGLTQHAGAVLFSCRRFKQCGARYAAGGARAEPAHA